MAFKKDILMIHFIHGLIGEPAHLDAVIRRLDLPPHAINNPKLDYLGQDVNGLIETIAAAPRDGGPQIVVGHSMGCKLALEMPFSVDHFVMLAPPLDFTTGTVPLRRSLIGDWVSDLYQQKGNIENEEELLAGVIKMVEAFMSDRRMISKIRTFRAEAQEFLDSPVLRTRAADISILLGAQDDSAPAERFVPLLADIAPDAQVDVIEACGHAVPMEHPDIVTATIRKAMDRCGAYRTERMALSSSS